MADKEVVVKSTGCLGGILALFTSYALNQSILWALFHGLLGWLYILYVVFFRLKEIVDYFKNSL